MNKLRNIKPFFRKFKRLVGSELIYIGSDILIKAIGFISMPFFLNAMSPGEFGEFNLYMTYKNIFTIFIGLNVSNAIVRYYVDKASEDRKYLATALWIIAIGGSLFSGLILSLNYIFNFLNIGINALIVVLISTAFNCFANVGREVLRSEKNHISYGATSVLNSLISTSLGLILVYFMDNDLAFWRIVSVAIASIITGTLLTLRIIKTDGIKGNANTAKYLLSYSIPLIPYTLSTTILSQVNKIFLSTISLEEVGIFSFASNLAMIIYIIAIALNRSLQPYVFEALRDNKDTFSRMKRNTVIFYLFYILFISGTDILIWIFGNTDYYGATKVIPILILAYGYFFLYSLYVNYLYYYKKNYAISLFSILSAVVALVANYFLITPLGYFGAAIATLLAYFSLFVFGYISVTKGLAIRIISTKKLVLVQVLMIVPVLVKIFIGG